MRFTLVSTLACIAGALVAGPAHAATPLFSVEARAITGNMPGAGATYVGPFFGDVEAHAEHDPPALQWLYNINQALFADAAAEVWTDIGSLTTHASAEARRIAATNFPAGVTSQAYGRYTDRLRVTSDTLPVGTPVSLTFANLMSVDWQGTGLYDGKAICVLQVGNLTSTSQFSAIYSKPAITSVAGAPIVLHTKVGATVDLSGRLDSTARGSFFVPGPLYDGQMTIDATCDTPLVAATAGVTVVAESGVDYAAL